MPLCRGGKIIVLNIHWKKHLSLIFNQNWNKFWLPTKSTNIEPPQTLMTLQCVPHTPIWYWLRDICGVIVSCYYMSISAQGSPYEVVFHEKPKILDFKSNPVSSCSKEIAFNVLYFYLYFVMDTNHNFNYFNELNNPLHTRLFIMIFWDILVPLLLYQYDFIDL